MQTREKMTCPGCGAKMNHHADKMLQTGSVVAGHFDQTFAAELIELHSCQACSEGASRTAQLG
jgi:hypothetical protein